ncbi:MAG: tRNA epoxyqueuosine(34) reductase QueG [Bacteroidetes bacterium]|nr:tRNA epoxyqueuosine(34) reductase QueG [Bacteroidota bacterium]
MVNNRSLAEDLKTRCKELGFVHVGIARAEELLEEGARLNAWLRNGFAGGMGWMGKREQERVDPGRVLPGVRSIVVVAMNYYTPASHSPEALKISRYAWGDDYHEVLGSRLTHVASWLENAVPGSSSRWYVDTGPVMEKAWAQRSGIGWIGKHATLITTTHGSWVFLGVLLTTAELMPDEPALDRCGTCTLCIEACPTKAIVDPYVVDARRCISYLTIEHRGELPAEFAGQLHGWIFGCDICQDVCPWNAKHSTETSEPAFSPREGMLNPDSAEIEDLDEVEFKARFRKSPLLRTRAEGMRRNIRAQQHGAGRAAHDP